MILGNIKKFWGAFLAALNEVQAPPVPRVQPIDDIKNINLLAISTNKISNLVCSQATFELESESKLVEPLREITKQLEKKKFDIVQNMLASGECFVFPAKNSNDDYYLWEVPLQNVLIRDIQDDKIFDIYAIVETAVEKNKTFVLVRHHQLIGSDLSISYEVYSDIGKRATYDKWSDLDGTQTTYKGVDHIGCGRYKNVTNARNLTKLGVPLNFGCKELEKEFFDILAKIQNEFDTTETKIFADSSIAQKVLVSTEVKDGKEREKFEYQVPKGTFLINGRNSTNLIDVFNPTIRYSSYYERLINILEMYEMQMGTSKGILTANTTTGSATATEVRRANADTLSLVYNIRDVVDSGNIEVLNAFNLIFNVPVDLWTYNADWYDPFQDPNEQWTQIKDGVNMGVIKKERATQWLYPSLSQEEAEKEVKEAMSNTGFDTALENTLTE